MRVKHACRHTIHWQTDQRHMKCKAAQDKDNVSSFPLLMSHEHFLASSRRLYTLQIHVHYIWKLTQSIYGCIFGTSFWAWNGKFAPLTIMIQTWIQWSSPSTQQWLKQPVRSLANTVRRKTLGHCRNSWSVRQKERTEKETIWTWRIWAIRGSEQQQQEVHGKRKLDRRTV